MTAVCPVCDGTITIPAGTEVSEILTCTECQTRVVVDTLTKDRANVSQAPAIEEDWGQ